MTLIVVYFTYILNVKLLLLAVYKTKKITQFQKCESLAFVTLFYAQSRHKLVFSLAGSVSPTHSLTFPTYSTSLYFFRAFSQFYCSQCVVSILMTPEFEMKMIFFPCLFFTSRKHCMLVIIFHRANVVQFNVTSAHVSLSYDGNKASSRSK